MNRETSSGGDRDKQNADIRASAPGIALSDQEEMGLGGRLANPIGKKSMTTPQDKAVAEDTTSIPQDTTVFRIMRGQYLLKPHNPGYIMPFAI